MTKMIIRSKRAAFAALIATSTVTWTAPAAADVHQISASGFFRHGVPAPDEILSGVLTKTVGDFFAAVQLPGVANGQRVCRFALVYEDNDEQSNIVAKLYSKAVSIGAGASEDNILMAQVASTGAKPGVRRTNATAIDGNKIRTSDSFYTVKLEIPVKTLNAIGVQIEYKPSC